MKYESKDNLIIVKGYTSIDRIGQRTIDTPVNVTNVEAGMRSIVSTFLRGLPQQTIAPSNGFTETFVTQITDDNRLESLTVLSLESNIGFKNTFDYGNRRRVFTTYKGRDLTPTNTEGNQPKIFSADHRNLDRVDNRNILK